MEFITIELRRNIQSCNVFIYLQQPTEQHLVQLILNNRSIVLKIANVNYPIYLPSIQIIPASLSCLNVHGKWIMFRVQSAPLNSAFGSFSSEFVHSKNNLMQNNLPTVTSEQIKLPPKNTQLSLLCNCCKNNISKTNIEFSKVLPLPSDECEPGEWFCCTHNGVDYKKMLQPGEQDLFYGSHYFILNKRIFTKEIKYPDTDVVCVRCLSTLGVNNDEETLKIWNHSVQFLLKSAAIDHNNINSPLIDFKLALENCITEDNFKEILFIAFEQNKYVKLLLKPMDKNLSLFIGAENNVDIVNLEEKQVLKVLYSCKNSEINVPNETNIRICKISLKSIIAGVDHLVASSKRIPPIYRTTDDYCIGYVL